MKASQPHSLILSHSFHPPFAKDLQKLDRRQHQIEMRLGWKEKWIADVQGDYVGFNSGNGENLSHSQAEPGQANCLAVA